MLRCLLATGLVLAFASGRAAAIQEDSRTVISDADLLGARWVEGRVVLPPGTPADESVRVVARGIAFPGRGLHGVPLGADGRFRVAFHPRTRVGSLAVDAHYLYLPERFDVVLDAVPAIVLEPKLGACVRGRCTLAASLADRKGELASAVVSLDGIGDAEQQYGTIDSRTKLAPDFTFELGGVLPEIASTLRVRPKSTLPAEREVQALKAGVATTIELELAAGIALRGRAVDEQGAALAGVYLSLKSPDGNSYHDGLEIVRTRSRKDGSFQFLGVPPGEWSVEGLHEGYLEGSLRTPLVADGGSADGLALVMPSGLTLRGRVTWPDGTPAADAAIQVEVEASQLFDLDVGSLLRRTKQKSAVDGTFAIPGLRDEDHRVRVAATNPQAAPDAADALWETVADRVRPGEKRLELVLRPPILVTGRVLDDAGAPIPRFELQARREVRAFSFHLDPGPYGIFDDPEGRFTLRLTSGRWELVASAKGMGDSAPFAVVLPEPSDASTPPPLELRIPRCAIVRGHVLDPWGRTVAGATIELLKVHETSSMSGDSEEGPTLASDETGAFEISRARPGGACAVARLEGFAPSLHAELRIEPGARIEDVVLTLREGGRIEGRVLTRDGAPAAGWSVSIDPYEDHSLSIETDATGTFLTDYLAPGRYTATAHDPANYAAAPAWSRSVEVRANDTARVVLGEAGPSRIQVHGLVLAGGVPLPGIEIDVARYADNPDYASTKRTSGPDGRYELPLERPGLHAWTLTTATTSILRWVRVPDAPVFEVAIDVGTGSVSGVVLGPDGAPLARIGVELLPDRDAADRTPSWTTGSATTDAQGRFAFESVPPGTYRVTSDARGSELFAPAYVDGVAVTDGVRTVTELRLEPSCSAQGVARDASGAPIADAAIFARDVHGGFATTAHLARTDALGRFRVSGLASGPTSFFARNPRSASVEGHLVELEAGRVAEIALVMVSATRLYVGVKDARDRWVDRAQVRVFDALGRDQNAVSTHGVRSDERNGTLEAVLTPGTYRIVVRHEDGRAGTASIDLTGEPVADIVVRLDG